MNLPVSPARSGRRDDDLGARLGRTSATFLVIGVIVGSGIFKKVGPMTELLRSAPLVLGCWFIAGLVTLFGALTYAEVAGRVAQTGGLYAYLRVMYGRGVAFFFGWACFSIIQSASIASMAYVFAEALLGLFPGLAVGGPVIGAKVLATVAILGLTTVNYLGIGWGAGAQNAFTATKLLGLGAVAAAAFTLHEALPTGAAREALAAAGVPSAPTGMALVSAAFTAMLGAFWAYDGLNDIGFVGGEVRDARRTIPFALILGVSIVMVAYLLLNWGYFHALGLASILAIAREPGHVFAVEMLRRLAGATPAAAVAALVMVSALGATNGSVLGSARIYYAMARDGVFFRRMGWLHPRRKTPTFALVAQGVWSSALVWTGSFDQLTDLLICASFVFYGAGAGGLLRLRRRGIGAPPFVVPTWIPIIYLAFCAVLVAVTFVQEPGPSICGTLMVLSGAPFYLSARRRARAAGSWNRDIISFND